MNHPDGLLQKLIILTGHFSCSFAVYAFKTNISNKFIIDVIVFCIKIVLGLSLYIAITIYS